MQTLRPTRRWIVAAATNSGIELDVRLGEAKVFAVYEVEESGVRRLLEHRILSPGEHLSFHSPDKLSPVLDGIDIVLAKQAGQGATRGLAQRGTKVIAVSGRIDSALEALARRGRLLDEFSACVSHQPAYKRMLHAPLSGSGELILLRSRLFGHITRGLA